MTPEKRDSGLPAKPEPVAGLTAPTRRRFLAYMAGSAAALYGLDVLPERLTSLADSRPVFNPLKSFSAWVRRPDDLLSLRFDFYNLVVDSSDPANPLLVRRPGTTASYIVANFWPQNVAEEAFLETSAGVPPDPPIAGASPPDAPVRSVLAGESRLGFELPAGLYSIPYRLDKILSWGVLSPRVVPVAKLGSFPRATSDLYDPNAWETALELPWRLVLSPHELTTWEHALAPVTHGGRTELWHTRMEVVPQDFVVPPIGSTSASPIAFKAIGGGGTPPKTVRAVWARDFFFSGYLQSATQPPDDTNNPKPFRMSLTERDRFDIVLNTATDAITPAHTFKAGAVDVDRLMLTALGAWIDSEGHWKGIKPLNNSLEEWRQRGTGGRDNFVRIVRKGYLFPYGHPASLIKITERKFNFSTGGTLGAYLRQRFFIVVRIPEKAFTAAQQPNGGRAFPFRNVRFTTLVTPNLDGAGDNFVPMVNAKPFLFHVEGTDWGGQKSEFTTPVVFVDESVAFNNPSDAITTLLATYASDPLFDLPFSGQRVNLAEVAPGLDTQVQASLVRMGGEGPTGGLSAANLDKLHVLDQAPFFPILVQADVRMVAAEQTKGSALPPTTVAIAPEYVTDGFGGANQGQLFAKLMAPVTLKFGADKAGGVMTPNIGIQGLSRSLGPIGDYASTLAGTFDPVKFFAGAEAKILGGLDLFKILLPALIDPTGPAGPDSMKITNRTEFDDGKLSPPTALVTMLDWKPQLKGDPLGIFQPKDLTGSLKAEVRTDLKNPSKSNFQVVGDLTNFTVNLFGDGSATPNVFYVIQIDFNRLTFKSKKGQKAHVDVDIAKTTFKGVLKFVDELSSFLHTIGVGSSGPSIDISPTGISASMSIAIPSLGVGVFSLQHLALFTSLNIPFSGSPARVRFSFCTRENPFLLTITFLGGGGFFGVAIGTDGFEMLEGSLEFGAAISVDLGVASGGVHITAGIYFKIEESPEGQDTTITGYFRMGGELSVLGLISISMEFYLSFTYESLPNKCTGVATLEMHIKILFFTIPVKITVQRKFGGQGDPGYLDAVPDQATWNEYCDAFAVAA